MSKIEGISVLSTHTITAKSTIMNRMITFNEYADRIEKEFLERRIRQECIYKRIVLFEKYMPTELFNGKTA